jgi:hypothetical protein
MESPEEQFRPREASLDTSAEYERVPGTLSDEQREELRQLIQEIRNDRS